MARKPEGDDGACCTDTVASVARLSRCIIIGIWSGLRMYSSGENRFEDSAAFLINHTVGEPKTTITANTFVNMPAPRVAELNSGLENTAKITNNEGLN